MTGVQTCALPIYSEEGEEETGEVPVEDGLTDVPDTTGELPESTGERVEGVDTADPVSDVSADPVSDAPAEDADAAEPGGDNN